MNAAYFHLLINHIPVILAPLGAAAAILAFIMRKRAIWLYAVACLTLSGLSAYPVMATGDAARRVVRDRVPSVSRATLEDHEEAGDITMWVLLAAGLVSAYAWWRTVRDPRYTTLPTWLEVLIIVTAIAAAGSVTWASWEGGMIIHKEAHSG
jgi:hypothetical protein